jgi:serine/threonine protein kinase
MPAHRSAKLDDPREFAGYHLMHCLGRGGMGEVWSVVRRGLYDITCALAIKAMLPELSDNEKYCEIFVAEGRIAMQLSSASIVPVFELGRHDGLLFMVMQRIDGVNLAELQRRTRNVYNTLPLDIVIYIIGELLAALYVAHEHMVKGQPAGVIHRDIKPANVMISSAGDVRLTDFGIARPATPHSLRAMPIGTLRYMSREQAEGRAERSSDLFAVGAILYELLSGRQFREGAQTEEQLYGAIFGYKDVPRLGRTVPDGVERLMRGLLHPDPKRRFQTAPEAMECLFECDGYRYSRLRLARIYETSVGLRSSGFTDSHAEAAPSFLLNRRSRPRGRHAGKRSTFVYSRAGESRETSFRVDEDALTSLHFPRLAPSMEDTADDPPDPADEPTSLYLPVVARLRRDEVGPHPIAPRPFAPTELVAPVDAREEPSDADKPRALTPTLELVLPVGQARQPATKPGAPASEAAEALGHRRPTVPVEVESDDPAPDPVEQRVARPVAATADRRESRDAAATSGTIEAPDRAPDLARSATPAAPLPRRRTPAHATSSWLYLTLVIALLCALVGVSTAWYLDSKDAVGAEAKP